MKEWIIRQVANGYIVERPPCPSEGYRRDHVDLHVFKTFAQAAAWIKRQMEPVA
jgi:hypothetical protein